MSLHLFANIVTPYAPAANNRGENDGNMTTLQKLIWHGQVHTTVSAESIRFALRRLLTSAGLKMNRKWDDIDRTNVWQDAQFTAWQGKQDKGQLFADDDILGFMSADGAKEEGEKGSAKVRRSPLEISRAVSLTPWPGDTCFNAASPGATPSAQKKGSAPVPYGTEMHATRYQFGLALTPRELRDHSNAVHALQALSALRHVAGNHGRFLYDFSPESIVIRITEDPAPRLLYCFDTSDHGKTVDALELARRVSSGDIVGKELYIGGPVAQSTAGIALKKAGAHVENGVVKAVEAAITILKSHLAAGKL